MSPTVLEGAIRCGCTHLIVDALLTVDEQRQASSAPRLAAAVQHLRQLGTWRGVAAPPAIVAQLGLQVALGTAAAATNGTAAAPLPCIHLGSSVLLPQLALRGPAATTTSATGGRFELSITAPPGDATGPAAKAAGLHCRSHGRLVGLAVSVVRPSGSGRASLDSLDCLPTDESEPEAAAAGEGGAAGGEPPAPVVLEAWAPDAASDECWGLYEFEAASGAPRSPACPDAATAMQCRSGRFAAAWTGPGRACMPGWPLCRP